MATAPKFCIDADVANLLANAAAQPAKIPAAKAQ